MFIRLIFDRLFSPFEMFYKTNLKNIIFEGNKFMSSMLKHYLLMI